MNSRKWFVLLVLFVSVLSFNSCDKKEQYVDPIPQEYVVESFKFLNPEAAQFDTVPGEYKMVDYVNNTADTFYLPVKVTSVFTSFFPMPDQKLPLDSNIDELEVYTADIDAEPKLHFDTNLFPFAFGIKQEIITGNTEYIMHVPPYHQYTGKFRAVGYAVKLPYKAVLTNTYTGAQLELTGVWEGMGQRTTEAEGGLTPLKKK